AAAAEWDAEFRADLESFLDAELIAACVASGIRERPPIEGAAYVAAVDPSGGGADAFTLAIAHADHDTDPPRVVLDCVRGWRTPNVETVVAEIADHLTRYGINEVIGDKYAGEWVPAAFRRHGITYEPAGWTRSAAYLELHPLIATGRAVLLDHAALQAELRALERAAPYAADGTPPTIRRGGTMTTRTRRRWRSSPPRRPHNSSPFDPAAIVSFA
ncbi:MAG: hypothetical protein ABIR79_08640, partial [Candidatus Binatia bacterium]